MNFTRIDKVDLDSPRQGFENLKALHSRSGGRCQFLTFSNIFTTVIVCRLWTFKNEDKKINREGCTSMRPQNRGLVTIFVKIRPLRIGRDQGFETT